MTWEIAPPSDHPVQMCRDVALIGIGDVVPMLCVDPVSQVFWTGDGIVLPSTVTGNPTGLVVTVIVAGGKPGFRAKKMSKSSPLPSVQTMLIESSKPTSIAKYCPRRSYDRDVTC